MASPNSPSGLVVCDLDGVVWLAEEPLPEVGSAVERLRAAGAQLLFLTNNSSRRVGDYIDSLARAGIEADADEVVTSAVVAGEHVAVTLPAGSRVLACAGDGVVEALADRGFEVVDAWPCEAVVVGWHRDFDYGRLERASTAVRNGARFVATNLDPTYPAPGGLVPGNGAIVAAVRVAAGREPIVVGKPFAPTVDLVRARAGSDGGVVVGDRVSTDGALAEALGWPFVLVRSDVTGSEDGDGDGTRIDVEGASLHELTDDIVRILGLQSSA